MKLIFNRSSMFRNGNRLGLLVLFAIVLFIVTRNNTRQSISLQIVDESIRSTPPRLNAAQIRAIYKRLNMDPSLWLNGPGADADTEVPYDDDVLLAKFEKTQLHPNYYPDRLPCELNKALFNVKPEDAEWVKAYTLNDKDPSKCDRPLNEHVLRMGAENWLDGIFHNFTPKTEYIKQCGFNLNKPKEEEDRCSAITGKRVLLNYAGGFCCATSQVKNCLTGLTIGGFDACLAFNEKGIDYEFATKNCQILMSLPGAGLWGWKPYIIYRTLLAMKDGDFLFYTDSGTEFIANAESSLMCQMAKLKQDVVVFSVGLSEEEFTKDDAFFLMDCESDACRQTWQRSGTFVIFRKSHFSLRFVSEWLTYSQDLRIIGNFDSGRFSNNETRKAEYKLHRNDQSVLSILSKKWNLELWPDPSQWGNKGPEENNDSIKAQKKFQFMKNRHWIYHTRDKS